MHLFLQYFLWSRTCKCQSVWLQKIITEVYNFMDLNLSYRFCVMLSNEKSGVYFGKTYVKNVPLFSIYDGSTHFSQDSFWIVYAEIFSKVKFWQQTSNLPSVSKWENSLLILFLSNLLYTLKLQLFMYSEH